MSNILDCGSTVSSEEIIEIVEQFESDHADTLLAIEQYSEDKELSGAVLKLVGIDDGEWGRYQEAKRINDECSGGDWTYGVLLIEDNYFVKYAEELCKDIGDIPTNFPAYIVIDWDATAENIKQDYTSVDIGDDTYWYRS